MDKPKYACEMVGMGKKGPKYYRVQIFDDRVECTWGTVGSTREPMIKSAPNLVEAKRIGTLVRNGKLAEYVDGTSERKYTLKYDNIGGDFPRGVHHPGTIAAPPDDLVSGAPAPSAPKAKTPPAKKKKTAWQKAQEARKGRAKW